MQSANKRGTATPGKVALGAVDDAGQPFVQTYTGGVSYWDGADWTALPSPPTTWFSDLYAVLPNDVWGLKYQEPLHFDGSTWSKQVGSCTNSQNGQMWSPMGKRLRRAPTGEMWLVDTAALFVFHAIGNCQRFTPQDPEAFQHSLVDIAWTQSGDVWVISHFGHLYRLVSNVLVPVLDLFGSVYGGAKVEQLIGMGKIACWSSIRRASRN